MRETTYQDALEGLLNAILDQAAERGLGSPPQEDRDWMMDRLIRMNLNKYELILRAAHIRNRTKEISEAKVFWNGLKDKVNE